MLQRPAKGELTGISELAFPNLVVVVIDEEDEVEEENNPDKQEGMLGTSKSLPIEANE